jgi:hypothetical protein
MECEDRAEPVPYVGAGGCPGGYFYYLERPETLYDPEQRLYCAGQSGNFHAAPCNEVITWDRTSPTTNQVQTDIRCCCKQEW